MFYKKPLLLKSAKTYKLKFTAFSAGMNLVLHQSLLPFKQAKLCYNFSFKNGALLNGNGFEKLELPIYEDGSPGDREILPVTHSIRKLWYFKYFYVQDNIQRDQIFYYSDNGKLYWFLIYSMQNLPWDVLTDTVFTSVPSALNYNLKGEDTMIISTEKEGMYYYDLKLHKVENAPHIVSMCIHYERMFAIVGGQRNRLAFSADLDPTNWNESLTEGGFIEMLDERGPLNRVISFNDYVYVFRDFGVAKVSAYGEQEGFSVSQLFVSSVKLYGSSVAVCGDTIMLAGKDGIYRFNGYSTDKIVLGIEKMFEGVDNENCSAVYYENKYYLACKLNFNDNEKIGCEDYAGGYINNALIELDLLTGDFNITRGADISSLVVIDDGRVSKLLASFFGKYKNRIGQLCKNGKIFDEPLKKIWSSPKSDMGYTAKVKRVKECYIKNKAPCFITISSEKQSKTYKVDGSEVHKRIKTDVSGKEIEVSFSSVSPEEQEIVCPEITIGVYE